MLGLCTPTDDAWIEAAIADVDRLLVDHAHCEMKAASNALSLAVRHGDRPALVSALAALAEEEIAHFRRVHELLVSRGVALGAPTVDPYAAALRRSVRGAPTLVERLLVAALIEARSCERFRLLSERVPDASLRALYAELLASEAGHYRIFLDLAIAEGARDGMDESAVRVRLQELSTAEATIVRALAEAPEGSESFRASRATVHG